MTRGSGILLHLTSLPGPHGIGTLGAGAEDFLEFLHQAGQRFWQFLPLGPTCPIFGNSPYMSMSAFAGNPLLIDPVGLVDSGLITNTDCRSTDFNQYLVDFPRVIAHRSRLLKSAFVSFSSRKDPRFDEFCHQNPWLDDYAHFMALRDLHKNLPWHQWPIALSRRQPAALSASREKLFEKILYYQFEQFVFYGQWHSLKKRARDKNIALIGDIPIYTAFDSADVWAHQDFYKLDPATGLPTHVAGVPPDYFSDTGQRWGNPVYRWHIDGKMNNALADWWRDRFQHIFSMIDIVRIDHFRGFESYWEIPAEEETAIKGSWVKGPGHAFFEAINDTGERLPIIAEDLGIITPEVEKLRDELGYPGMKILQFAFDNDPKNLYLPHNFSTANCVVYTGTHDNDTSLGWYMSEKSSPDARSQLRRYANSNGDEIAWDFIRLALSSVADLAVIPLQDVLGFGSDCRMNTPSTTGENWCWRVASRFLADRGPADRLRELTRFYNRLHPAADTQDLKPEE